MWTKFMDMYSGGGSKEAREYIYIEAPEEEAKVIFYNRFGHSADRVTCTCCGSDYSVSESETLEEATAYERGCMYDKEQKKYIESPDYTRHYRKYRSIDEYKQDAKILIIAAEDIKQDERFGDVPEEGYVWV